MRLCKTVGIYSRQIQQRDETWWGCAGAQSVSHSKHYRTDFVALSRVVCYPHVLCRSLEDGVSSCSVEQTAAITKVSRSQIYLPQLDHMGPH